MKSQRNRRGALIAVALLAVVAVLAGFMWWNGSSNHDKKQGSSVTAMHNRDIGAGVSVSGEKVPSDMHAQVAKHANEPQIGLTSALSKTLEIGPSGKLAAPATITMTLDRAVSAKSTVVVATNPTHTKDGWQLVSAQLSADRKHATFTVNHLSWFKALLVDIGSAVSELKKEFVDGMTAGVFARAEKPTCSNESLAKRDDYTISSSAKDTLYWCVGVENDKRVLKVVNRRSYPLELKTSNATFTSSGHGSLDLAGLAQLGHHTIVMPGEEAVMTVSSLKAGQKATIDSNLSSLAMGLHTVDVIGTAVAQLTLKVDPSALKNTRELVNDVLSMKSCIDVLGDMNVGHFLSGCFDAHTLSKLLNWRAAILAPVMTAFSAIGLTHAWLNLVGDSRNGRAKYNVTIAKQDALAPYVGTWYRDNQDITIKPDGMMIWHAWYGGIGKCVGKWVDRSDECWVNSYGTARAEGNHVVLEITKGQQEFPEANDDTGATWRMEHADNGMVTLYLVSSPNPDALNDAHIHYCRSRPKPGSDYGSPCKGQNL